MKKIAQSEIRQMIQEEMKRLNRQNEGLGSLAKSAALAADPTGISRFVSDYSRAEGFSDVEGSLEDLESRVSALELALKALAGMDSASEYTG